jgi:hypothetical protein
MGKSLAHRKPFRYRDPFKGSTMMVLRDGRIDRRWGGPYCRAWEEAGVVVGRGPVAAAPTVADTWTWERLQGWNGGGTHEENRSVGVRVAGRRRGVA